MFLNSTFTIMHPNPPGPKANILIGHDGHALLADFSLVKVTSDPSTFSSSCIEGGSAPWMSPELLAPDHYGLKKCCPTKDSDCYALGMVVYEVLSGHHPFFPRGGPIVMVDILDGKRPRRPKGDEGSPFTDDIWRILESCWECQPSARPSVETVLSSLGGTLPLGRPDSLEDGGIETDTDTQSEDLTNSSGGFPLFHLKSQAYHLWGIIGPPIKHGDDIPINNGLSHLTFLCCFILLYLASAWVPRGAFPLFITFLIFKA